MERMVECTYRGRTYYLNYSISVMFEVEEKYGTVEKLMEELMKPGRAGFEATRYMMGLMATAGELARRAAGYDPEPIINRAETGANIMAPAEYSLVKDAVTKAIVEGYRQETKAETEEIDEGLMEIQRKKEKTVEGLSAII